MASKNYNCMARTSVVQIRKYKLACKQNFELDGQLLPKPSYYSKSIVVGAETTARETHSISSDPALLTN